MDDGDAAFTFEQWVLFQAIVFRDRYRAVASAKVPDLTHEMPLEKGGKLTVVQVNSGEAVHFLYHGTPAKEATDCRHLVLAPPEGLSLRDWAMLHEEGYKRFVERTVAARAELVGHYVVFPDEQDAHALAVEAADRLAREHAATLRGS